MLDFFLLILSEPWVVYAMFSVCHQEKQNELIITLSASTNSLTISSTKTTRTLLMPVQHANPPYWKLIQYLNEEVSLFCL